MSRALWLPVLLGLALLFCSPRFQESPSPTSVSSSSDEMPSEASPPVPAPTKTVVAQPTSTAHACATKFGMLLCRVLMADSLPSTMDVVVSLSSDPLLSAPTVATFSDSLVARIAAITGYACDVAADYGDMIVVSAVPVRQLAEIAAIPFVGSVESAAIFSLPTKVAH